MTSDPCTTLPPNPDVAGVGIRILVYAQAFLSFVAPLLATIDGKIVVEGEERSEILQIENLLLSLGLATTALAQSRSNALSVYHAMIVSIMGWMLEGPLIFISCSTIFRAVGGWALRCLRKNSRNQAFDAIHQHGWVPYEMALSRILHGIFGTLLWNTINTFGGDKLSKCTDSTYFFWNISVFKKFCRAISLIFHVVRAVDGMLGLFTNGFLAWTTPRRGSTIVMDRLVVRYRLGFAAIILVLPLVSTEIMVWKNSKNLVAPEERIWGFAQILAVWMIVSQVREACLAVWNWMWPSSKKQQPSEFRIG